MSMNKVILIGMLGADPVSRVTNTGKPVCNMNIATNSKWGPGKGQQETEWHKITAFSGAATVAQKFLRKGMEVCVEGSIKTNKWVNKEGREVSDKVIVVHRITFLRGPGKKHEDAYEQEEFSDETYPDDDSEVEA